jgi:hypothetical protein
MFEKSYSMSILRKEMICSLVSPNATITLLVDMFQKSYSMSILRKDIFYSLMSSNVTITLSNP